MAIKIKLKDAQVGDIAYVDGYSGFCYGSDELITSIITKYNPNTGEPYKVICCGRYHYRMSDGQAINEALAYKIFGVYRLNDTEKKSRRRAKRKCEHWDFEVEDDISVDTEVDTEVPAEIIDDLRKQYPNAEIL